MDPGEHGPQVLANLEALAWPSGFGNGLQKLLSLNPQCVGSQPRSSVVGLV